MDKRTLATYGFIIVTTLVVGLMIVISTPAGEHIVEGVKKILSSVDPRIDSIAPILQGSGNNF